MKTNAVSVAGLLTIPLSDTFSLGLRAGVAYSNLDFDSAADFRFNGQASPVERTSDSQSNIAPVFGVNVEYALTPRVSLRADWQRFNDVGDGLNESFDGFDIDLLSLTVVGRF